VHAPQILGRAGVALVGPTLMTHGTEAQRKEWMPRILACDNVWCQLFSEPDAGSDLAALSTRAEKRGGVYVVTGQKVWSSYARFADWGIALVRTDPAAPRHKGISMLAIPMESKGVDVRPLRQITGESEFNEVFLDEVEVPVENLIGPENEGWAVANTTLVNERGATFVWKEQVLHAVAFDLLVKACARAGRRADPIVRERLARSWIDVEIFRLHNERTRARVASGEGIGAQSSIVKLFWAGMSQRLYETAVDVLGPDALLLRDDAVALDLGRWPLGLLASRANSIMGGTSEIQRNIIGERLLGLPREPRIGEVRSR
jgi:alkylation response protein AidB-like acyl-CoA dehydrogenase